MTGLETILGGIVVALAAGSIGTFFGEKNKVSDTACKERQGGCIKVLETHLSYIKDTVDEIKKDIKDMKE